MTLPPETFESGPVLTDPIWDTRTRENSQWCKLCNHWLRLSTFSWVPEAQRLEYHQKHYCKSNPERVPL